LASRLRQQARPATRGKTEKERQLAYGRGGERGEGGGRGAESYNRKKAWSYVNHSILSVMNRHGVL
jgi:hypothetical protein